MNLKLDGRKIITGSNDRTAILWDIEAEAKNRQNFRTYSHCESHCDSQYCTDCVNFIFTFDFYNVDKNNFEPRCKRGDFAVSLRDTCVHFERREQCTS